MHDVYVARQPIFDKSKQIYAYELLFRDGAANCVPDIDGDVATTTLLANTFFTIGMGALAGGRKTFINFTQNLLEKRVPLLLPANTTVVEILEDVTPGSQVIDACAQLAARGYTIALDDFVYSPAWEPLIALADIIKFDFRLTPREAIDAYLSRLPTTELCLLAEKVETHAEFEAAQKMGFELFQGYFFCKPDELIRMACIRGRFCELLGAEARERTSPSEMFTLGMFSLIDAVIDLPMDVILEELPLSRPIKRALVDAKGRLAGYIALVRAYETGQWHGVSRLAKALGADMATFPGLYLQACRWSAAAAEAT